MKRELSEKMYFIYIKLPGAKRYHVYNPFTCEYGMGLVFAPRFYLGRAQEIVEYISANSDPSFSFQIRESGEHSYIIYQTEE